MEKSEAVHIIKSLASGIDPQTGMEIPLNSPYRHVNYHGAKDSVASHEA